MQLIVFLVFTVPIIALIIYLDLRHSHTPPLLPQQYSVSATVLKITPPLPRRESSMYWDNRYAVLFQFEDGRRWCFRIYTADWIVAGDQGILTYEEKGADLKYIDFEPKPHSSEIVPPSIPPVPAVIVRLSSIDSKVLFELTDGSRVNLTVPAAVFSLLREGMHGQLSYQGDTFQLFTPDASPSSPSF